MRTNRAGISTSRAIVAGLLVAVAAITGAARATDTSAPAVIATSVDNQWSAGSGPIAARFDRELSATGSTAELSDRTGHVYTGRVVVSASTGKEKDTLIYYVQLGKDETMLEESSPYTIRFTAQSAAPGQGSSEVTRMFTLDATRPVAVIANPAPSQTPVVIGPTDTLALDGVAYDPSSQSDLTGMYRSGLTALEVQFFELKRPNGTNGLSGEATELRQRPELVACSNEVPGCANGADASWVADTSGVGPGHWTVKVYAIDRSGNRSLAATVSFVKLAAASAPAIPAGPELPAPEVPAAPELPTLPEEPEPEPDPAPEETPAA